MRLDPEAEARVSQLPLGPGREPFSRRARVRLALLLGALLVIAVVASAVLATGSGKVPGRLVTIPAADRSASAALLRAAAAVGFHSPAAAGAGGVESLPASAARASGSRLLAVGSQAPGFMLRTPEGVPVELSRLRGKAVLLEFFATWCAHCAAEAPHLESLYRSLPRSHVAFVAVNADSEDAASILAYHIYFGLQFPAVLDPGSHLGSFHARGPVGPVTTRYRVATTPTFYVLDRSGRVVWRGVGEQPDSTLRAALRQAAGGPAAPAGSAGSGCPAAAGTCTGP